MIFFLCIHNTYFPSHWMAMIPCFSISNSIFTLAKWKSTRTLLPNIHYDTLSTCENKEVTRKWFAVQFRYLWKTISIVPNCINCLYWTVRLFLAIEQFPIYWIRMVFRASINLWFLQCMPTKIASIIGRNIWTVLVKTTWNIVNKLSFNFKIPFCLLGKYCM